MFFSEFWHIFSSWLNRFTRRPPPPLQPPARAVAAAGAWTCSASVKKCVKIRQKKLLIIDLFSVLTGWTSSCRYGLTDDNVLGTNSLLCLPKAEFNTKNSTRWQLWLSFWCSTRRLMSVNKCFIYRGKPLLDSRRTYEKQRHGPDHRRVHDILHHREHLLTGKSSWTPKTQPELPFGLVFGVQLGTNYKLLHHYYHQSIPWANWAQWEKRRRREKKKKRKEGEEEL